MQNKLTLTRISNYDDVNMLAKASRQGLVQLWRRVYAASCNSKDPAAHTCN